MSWVRLDDQFFAKPRARAAGLEGRSLFLAGLCYSAANLTDGIIPNASLPLVAAMAEVEPNVADHLVAVGLWEAHEDSYLVVDYLRFNPSREQVIAEREAAAERQRRSRERSRRDSRRNNGVSSAAPVPVPTSDLSTRRPGNSRAEPPDPPDDDEVVDNSSVPDEVWEHYAELKLALEPPGKVDHTGSWKRTTRRNARVEQGELAARWWAMFDLTPRRLAQALVDGRAPQHVARREAS